MPTEHEQFIRAAIEEAEKAGAEGNIAVGSVIVQDGALVARGRNLVSSNLDPTAHAEVVALREGSTALKKVDLSGCSLYTTFEPCPMCCGAIMTSGIATLVMGARHKPEESRWGPYSVEKLLEMAKWRDRIEIVTGILPQECVAVRRKLESINVNKG